MSSKRTLKPVGKPVQDDETNSGFLSAILGKSSTLTQSLGQFQAVVVIIAIAGLASIQFARTDAGIAGTSIVVLTALLVVLFARLRNIN